MRGFLAALICLVISELSVLAQSMNPDVSANGLLLYRKGNHSSSVNSDKPNGFSIQEIETQLSSTVDPYFKANFMFSFEMQPGENGKSPEFHFSPEEAFVETLSLPMVTVRAGKFKAFLGRHNQIHTHARPFIDQPLAYDKILGDEGLNEVGISAAYLVPSPWYFEIVAQGLSARNNNLFDKDSADDIAGVFFVKNLWDLTDSTSFELDGTYGIGNNAQASKTQLFDAAATVKWRPLAYSSEQSVAWTTEWLHAMHQMDGTGAHNEAGVSSWLQFQFLKNWWLESRGELYMTGAYDNVQTKKASGLIGYIFTEYSALRAQYDAQKEQAKKLEHRVSLQLNISIGAHPAHAY